LHTLPPPPPISTLSLHDALPISHVLSTVVDSIDLSQPGAWNIDGREVAFQVEEAVHDITIVLAVGSYNLAAAIKPCGQGVEGSWNIDSGHSGSTRNEPTIL